MMSLFTAPSLDQLRELSDRFGYLSTDDELKTYQEVAKGAAADFAHVWNMAEDREPVKYPRTPGYRPSPTENPLNAWYYKANIRGSSEGILKDKKIAVKDNVFVAGVPMMDGSRALEGFTPNFDATVVQRILDNGGEILGKSTCEDLCLSGGSYHTALGPVQNPWNVKHSAGGSSSGSGVLVATGEVDMAIGGDQGGSIRIPASCCGIVGLKPTFGLVPYTGIIPIENSIDHTGPMTRTVKDCALFLEAIAGFDNNRDFRQPSCGFICPKYSQELEKPLGDGIKVAVLKEGYTVSTEEVNGVVKNAVAMLQASGKFAKVDEVSIPMHLDGHCIWAGIGVPGLRDQMMDGAGYGYGTAGDMSAGLSEKLAQGLKANGHSLSHNVKYIQMFATYIHERYGPAIYAKSQHMSLVLRRKYDQVLKDYDVIVMPTLPQTPCKIPTADTSIIESMGNSLATITNTAPFDFTHHPAITINAGFGADTKLPVGIMLVGKHFQDAVCGARKGYVEPEKGMWSRWSKCDQGCFLLKLPLRCRMMTNDDEDSVLY